MHRAATYTTMIMRTHREPSVLVLLELRQIRHAGPWRLVVGDTEDLALADEDGGEVGVVGHDDALSCRAEHAEIARQVVTSAPVAVPLSPSVVRRFGRETRALFSILSEAL